MLSFLKLVYHFVHTPNNRYKLKIKKIVWIQIHAKLPLEIPQNCSFKDNVWVSEYHLLVQTPYWTKFCLYLFEKVRWLFSCSIWCQISTVKKHYCIYCSTKKMMHVLGRKIYIISIVYTNHFVWNLGITMRKKT